MNLRTEESSTAWIKQLPRSKMGSPRTFGDRAKYMLWRAYTPCHPLIRNTAFKLGFDKYIGVVKQHGRQNYLLGHLAPGTTVKEFVSYLLTQGFANHFVAWKDAGEVVSLRRVENFSHQYHIRIFKDGEVRGHYELTPESNPFSHLRAVGQERRSEEFAKILGDYVVSRR